MSDADRGALAAALAKAQSEFGAITRDKKVTVQMKSGGSYEFSYAPLDSILSKVRAPLAANGLAIAQLLDSGPDGDTFLETLLLHESGASLSGRTPVPTIAGIQEFGSAITYLRRYAIQAILGIAAEEDDDGNRAAGNRSTPNSSGVMSGGTRPPPPRLEAREGSLIGIAELAAAPHDFLLREQPDGLAALGFKLTGLNADGSKARGNFRVIAVGPLATALSLVQADVVDKRVIAYGSMSLEEWPAKGTKPAIPYTRLMLSRIETPSIVLPMPESVRDLSAEDQAELDALVV